MKLFIGTSGFSYPAWKGPFYPEKMKPAEMLSFYAQRLNTVEINNTFYRMPNTKTLESWCEQTPESFCFSIKASRRITHQQRLKEVDDNVQYLFKQARVLGKRLGPVLFQLPPYLKKDTERLKSFLQLLPEDIMSVIEFRNVEWFCDEVYDLLKSHNVTMGYADGEVEGEPFVSTGKRGYIRLRHETYDDIGLKSWADKIRKQGWDEVYVYFKHEDEGFAPRMAKALRDVFEK